jgi:death-on-curing protein
MTNLLEYDEIISIHNFAIQNTDAEIGILSEGNLKSAIEKPDYHISGREIYDDIYTKGAVLVEALIRAHPFVDGNKRTALFALIEYLRKNDHTIILPLSSVRVTVKIAKTISNHPKNIEKLIKRIAKWIRNFSFETSKLNISKIRRGLRQYLILGLLAKYGLKGVARFILLRFLAYDLYPREGDQIIQTLTLLNQNIRKTMETIQTDFKKNN